MLLHSHTQLQGEFVNKLRLTRTVRQLSADHLFTTTPFHRHFPLFHYTHYFKKFTPSLQVYSRIVSESYVRYIYDVKKRNTLKKCLLYKPIPRSSPTFLQDLIHKYRARILPSFDMCLIR